VFEWLGVYRSASMQIQANASRLVGDPSPSLLTPYYAQAVRVHRTWEKVRAQIPPVLTPIWAVLATCHVSSYRSHSAVEADACANNRSGIL
jgi:hypothetical protein